MKEKQECTEDYEQKQLIMSDDKCKQCECYYTCRFMMLEMEDVINGD